MDETVSTDVVGGDSPATDMGVSAPVADAPVGTEGLNVGTGVAPALAPSTADPNSGAPATPFAIPADDSDLEGPNAPQQGVEGIRQMRQAIRQRDSELAAQRQLIEQFGGEQTLQASMQLMGELFRPVIDPNTGQPKLDNFGLPEVDPRGFVDKLAQESSGTLLALGDALLEAKLPSGRPIIDVVVRDVLGLDPRRLEEYRTMPAQQFGSDVTAEELADIPEAFHPAYMAMTERERNSLQGLDIATRDLLLKNAQKAHEFTQFQQQQLQYQQQQAEAQQQQRQAQALQAGYDLALGVRERHVQSLQGELGKIQFSADPATNQLVQGLLANAAGAYVDNSPELKPLVEQTEKMYFQVAQLEAQHDKIRANQLRIQADQNAQRIFTKARIYALDAVKALQGIAGGQPVTNGQQQVRPVIPGQQTQMAPGQRRDFQPFGDESKRLAQEMVDQAARSGNPRQGW